MAPCAGACAWVKAATSVTLSDRTTANTLIPMNPFIWKTKQLILLHLRRPARRAVTTAAPRLPGWCPGFP